MILSDTAIQRPVLATVFSLLIVVLGLGAITTLAVRELPDIETSTVAISTDFPGAAPPVVESEITEPIESALGSVSGVDLIRSTSRQGSATTVLEFEPGIDIDAAANDVRDAIGRVTGQLPDDVDAPFVRKADDDASPSIWLTLTSEDGDTVAMTDFAQRVLEDRLALLQGVSRIFIGAEREQAMRIWLDRDAMAARGLTPSDVSEALRAQNVEMPAGRLEAPERVLNVRTATRLNTAEAFEEIPVERSDGATTKLADIARVERSSQDDGMRARANGEPAIGLGVVRNSTANVVAVSNRVRAEVEDVQDQLPDGMSLRVVSDDAEFVRAAIEEVLRALAIAVVLVVAVIFVFLRSVRAAFIPAVTIPVALIGAFAAMAALGYSINTLTLLALILAIGLVVDDAIVMLENIQRRIENGEPRLLAALRGARQVGFAIVATTLTLIAVFVPISFMSGEVGRLFSEFGIVLAAAVAFSSIVALTLAPMLASKWLGRTSFAAARQRQAPWLVRVTEPAFRAATNGYHWLLAWALRMPIVVLTVAVLTAAAGAALYLDVPQEIAPQEERGTFFVRVSPPEGSSPAYMNRQTLGVEQVVESYRESGEVKRMFGLAGWRGGGIVIGDFQDWETRERSEEAIVNELRGELGRIPGSRNFVSRPNPIGSGSWGDDLRLFIGGSDYQTVRGWAERIAEQARESDTMRDVELGWSVTRPELQVDLDRQRAFELGISARRAGQALEATMTETTVTRYKDRGREYDVVVQAEPGDREVPQDLGNIFVRGDNGLTPLSAITTTETGGAVEDLRRIGRQPTVELSGNLAEGAELGDAVAELESLADAELPPEGSTTWRGEARTFQETGNQVYVAFALGLLVVFLVLAAQFESFVHPFIILASVPLAVTGAMGALHAADMTLNIFSQIGLILLIGLMAKHGILLVEFANQMRHAHSMRVRQAILTGSTLRFRPIVMTTISTIFGAIPLVISTGPGAASRAAIGTVVVSGLGFATVLTLFVIPVLYDLLARFTKPSNAVAQALTTLAIQEDGTRAAGGEGRAI